MSKQYTIHISDAFKKRFPEEERAVAAEFARHITQDILFHQNPRQNDRMYMVHNKLFGHLPADERPNPPICKRSKDGKIDLAYYFDEQATIRLVDKLSGAHCVIPIMTAIAMNRYIGTDSLDALENVFVNHPKINDELGNGTFASPLRCALMLDQGWPVVELLSHSKHINPNVRFGNRIFDYLTMGDENTGYAVVANENNLQDISAFQMLIHKGTERQPDFYDKTELCEIINRFVDNGMRTDKDGILLLGITGLKDVERHVREIEKRLKTVDVAHCTLQDIKHAYGQGKLQDWFVRATEDDDVRDHLVELRDELPTWMQSEFAAAYALLQESGTWVERTGDRTGWRIE